MTIYIIFLHNYNQAFSELYILLLGTIFMSTRRILHILPESSINRLADAERYFQHSKVEVEELKQKANKEIDAQRKTLEMSMFSRLNELSTELHQFHKQKMTELLSNLENNVTQMVNSILEKLGVYDSVSFENVEKTINSVIRNELGGEVSAITVNPNRLQDLKRVLNDEYRNVTIITQENMSDAGVIIESNYLKMYVSFDNFTKDIQRYLSVSI